MIRTDMAAEFTAGKERSGVVITHRRIPYPVTEVSICTEQAAKSLNKPLGRYITVEGLSFDTPFDNLQQTVDVVKPLLQSLLPKRYRQVLIVGLGNREITPDALGPRAIRQILVTRHLQQEQVAGWEEWTAVSALAPGVLGQTGIESSVLIQAISSRIKPDLVLVIDALAAAEKQRLCSSIQFSNTGIVPGSGVANHRLALDQKTLGIPVIVIGVPTVIALEQGSGLFVTPREVDLCIEHAGKFIGMLCNSLLQKEFPFETMLTLTGE